MGLWRTSSKGVRLGEGEDGATDDAGHLVLHAEGDGAWYAIQRAQVIGEVPGEIAGAAEVPEGEQAADFAGVLGEVAERVCGKHGKFRRHYRFEERVHGFVVGVLRARKAGDNTLLCVGGQQSEGEIVVDVRVHSGERELDAVDAGGTALVQQLSLIHISEP